MATASVARDSRQGPGSEGCSPPLHTREVVPHRRGEGVCECVRRLSLLSLFKSSMAEKHLPAALLRSGNKPGSITRLPTPRWHDRCGHRWKCHGDPRGERSAQLGRLVSTSRAKISLATHSDWGGGSFFSFFFFHFS